MGAHHGPAKGLMRWVLATNHKDIGTMYLWFAFSMFIVGGAFAMIIRAELFQPGLQIVEPNFFNQMTTLHGLVMIWLRALRRLVRRRPFPLHCAHLSSRFSTRRFEP